MSNSYFQFKQFTVHQDLCAMKVSTEACLFGAWVKDNRPNKILDIGTGTGLLSLMIAQRMDGTIDAVEIDCDASKQAVANFTESSWSDRLTVYNQDIASFTEDRLPLYDLIVSNPPFFKQSQRSASETRNLALHQSKAFDTIVLGQVLNGLLSEKGRAYVLYPEHESKLFAKEIDLQKLYSSPALIIRNQPNGKIFRVITEIRKVPFEVNPEELHIRNGNEYSYQFIHLLKDYYLNL